MLFRSLALSPHPEKTFLWSGCWSPPLPHSREQRGTSPKITCSCDGWSLSPEQPCCPLFECTKKENVHRHSLFLYLGSTRRRQGPHPGSRSDAPGLLRDRDTACPCLASLLLTETGNQRPDRRPLPSLPSFKIKVFGKDGGMQGGKGEPFFKKVSNTSL